MREKNEYTKFDVRYRGLKEKMVPNWEKGKWVKASEIVTVEIEDNNWSYRVVGVLFNGTKFLFEFFPYTPFKVVAGKLAKKQAKAKLAEIISTLEE